MKISKSNIVKSGALALLISGLLGCNMGEPQAFEDTPERQALLQEVSTKVVPAASLNLYIDQESELAASDIDLADVTAYHLHCMKEKLSEHASDEKLKIILDPGLETGLAFTSGSHVIFNGAAEECKALTDSYIEQLKLIPVLPDQAPGL